MTISLELSEADATFLKKCAEMKGITVSEFIRNIVMERIEDEYDVAIANEAYEDYLKDNKKSRPIEKLWEESEIK